MLPSTRTVFLVAVAVLTMPATAVADALKVVVFDVEPVDLSQTAAIDARVKTETALARKLVSERGYTIVDTAPQAKKIADNLPLSQCNGCDQDIAKALGADLEVTLAAQALSAAVFSLSGNVKEVASNRVLRSGVIDIHGDSDDEWNHGIKFLVKERLLTPPLPKDPAELRKAVNDLPKSDP